MPTLAALTLYPVKSCAGIALREAVLTEAGLMSERIYDREWMVVDANGEFLSQRSHPRMALIRPRIKAESLELRAPGMLPLEVPLGLPAPEDERVIEVRVFGDTVKAYDCDEVTAHWFSSFLGTPSRLARFHIDARRVVDRKWTGGIETTTMFSDGFPVLVISQASLADLNEKLLAQGREAVAMDRFRPNVVLDGIAAFEEDFAATIRAGEAVLKPVKPCARCAIPSVDQTSGEHVADPLDILRGYRANAKVKGGITFGMNAIVTAGAGTTLRVGQELEIELAF
ncbi:MAG TPA: MOSC N-terminal beta barrel domain-containing protein [Noviherbaspirillum sp.]